MHCIYKITNTQNGKYYVGRTENFTRRKRSHFSHLRRGTHHNPKLQASFNKWGEGCFRMDAEVTGLTRPEAVELEQLCLDEVCGLPRCYNISTSSRGGSSPFATERVRQLYGKYFTCTWPDGTVKQYLSTRQAAADLGISRNEIGRYLKGTRTPGARKRSAHLHGCKFQYVD
jgi:predicted GIY-YIG superfamily endonuclease